MGVRAECRLACCTLRRLTLLCSRKTGRFSFQQDLSLAPLRREEIDVKQHVYEGAANLQRKQKVGDGDCVDLIKRYTDVGWTGRWRAGAQVLNNPAIKPGTAIATFVNGRWPGLSRGNHAAFFLRHGVNGFWVIDQYAEKKLIESRFIEIQHPVQGRPYSISNDARAFYTIETP